MLAARPEAEADRLGEAVSCCLRTEVAPEGVADLSRNLFPNATSLRCAGLPRRPEQVLHGTLAAWRHKQPPAF